MITRYSFMERPLYNSDMSKLKKIHSLSFPILVMVLGTLIVVNMLFTAKGLSLGQSSADTDSPSCWSFDQASNKWNQTDCQIRGDVVNNCLLLERVFGICNGTDSPNVSAVSQQTTGTQCASRSGTWQDVFNRIFGLCTTSTAVVTSSPTPSVTPTPTCVQVQTNPPQTLCATPQPSPTPVPVSSNNPSIFTQQNTGPSAPKLTIGRRLYTNVPSNVGWAVQGEPVTGRADGIKLGKDYMALKEQWTQYYATSNPTFVNTGGGVPRPSNCSDTRVFIDWGDGKTSWLGRAKGQEMTPVSGGRPTDLVGTSDCGTNHGGAKGSFGFYEAYNSAGSSSPHIYPSTGLYTVTAKACYESGLPLPTGPGIIIRNPAGFNWTSPLDGRCSPEAKYSVRVISPDLVGGNPGCPQNDGSPGHFGPDYPCPWNLNYIALAAENLLMQPAPNNPNRKPYPVYKAGNNIPMGIVRVINIGTATETINSIGIPPSALKLPEFNGDGSCCHVSIHKVRMKMNGGVIGEIPMQWRNPAVGIEIMRFSQPVSVAAGQSVDLSLYGDAHVDVKFAASGRSSENTTGSTIWDDIEQYGGVGPINITSPITDKANGVLWYSNMTLGSYGLTTFMIDNIGNTPGSIQTY